MPAGIGPVRGAAPSRACFACPVLTRSQAGPPQNGARAHKCRPRGRAEPPDDTEIYAERDTYVRSGTAGYAAEHAEIFDPIERAYALTLELSALIALHVGAYG